MKHDPEFGELRPVFRGKQENLLFSSLYAVPNEQILPTLNTKFFPFYARILSEARQAHYQMYSMRSDDVVPKFLLNLLRSEQFFALINAQKINGIKNEQGADFLGEFEIPLPSREEQEALISEIDRQRAIIAGAEMVLANWQVESSLFYGDGILLSEIAYIGTGSTPAREKNEYFGGNVNWVLTAEVDECEITSTAETLTEQAVKDYGLKIYPEESILMAMYGQGKTRGKVALLKCPAAITQNCAAIVIRHQDVVPKYIYCYLRSIYEIIRGQEYSGAGVPHLNLKIVANIRVPIPSMEEQETIVAEIEQKLHVAHGLNAMRAEAEGRIQKIISAIWEH